MPRYSYPTNNTLAGLIQDQGRIRAQQALAHGQSGQIWANALGNVGQIAGRAIEQHGTKKEEEKAQEQEVSLGKTWASVIERWDGKDPLKLHQNAVLLFGQEKAAERTKEVLAFRALGQGPEEEDRKNLITTLKGIQTAPPDMIEGLYGKMLPTLTPQLTKFVPGLSEEDIPKQWEEEIRGQIPTILQMLGEAPPQTEWRKPGDVPVTGGVPGAPIPGGGPTPPAVGSEAAYIVGKYGPNPTPEQQLQGRAEFAASGRAPAAPGKPGTRLIAEKQPDGSVVHRIVADVPGRVGVSAAPAKVAEGKQLAPSTLDGFKDAQAAIEGLREIRTMLTEEPEQFGPVTGRLGAKYPGSRAQEIQGRIDKIRQRVGRALEGGVLRKEDEEKYKLILATIADMPNVGLDKVEGLLSDFQRDLKISLGLFEQSGYDVSGARGVLKGVLETQGVDPALAKARERFGY